MIRPRHETLEIVGATTNLKSSAGLAAFGDLPIISAIDGAQRWLAFPDGPIMERAFIQRHQIAFSFHQATAAMRSNKRPWRKREI